MGRDATDEDIRSFDILELTLSYGESADVPASDSPGNFATGLEVDWLSGCSQANPS